MAKYIIDNEIFDTRKVRRVIKYESYTPFLIRIYTLYRTKKGKWVETVKSYDANDIRIFFRDDRYVENLLKRLQKVRIYEKYFGKLKEV